MTRAADDRRKVPRAAARRRTGLVMNAVRPIAGRIAREKNLVLWDLEFAREAGSDVLRVSVDRRGGISAEEITGFAEAFSRTLDAEDAVPGEARYVLEVSSPGAERKVRTPEEFLICEGRLARITFRTGRNPVEGSIAAVTGEHVTIDTDGEQVLVAYGDISQARLKVPGTTAASRTGA